MNAIHHTYIYIYYLRNASVRRFSARLRELPVIIFTHGGFTLDFHDESPQSEEKKRTHERFISQAKT